MFWISYGWWTTVAGYSVVTRIPRGATNLDIRQYAPNDNKDDDIYLGKFAILATAFVLLLS